MATTDFFETPTSQSQVKANIVAQYFYSWAKIIVKQMPAVQRIAYINLFAGRGVYEDGTYSTPLKILKRAIDNPDIAKKIISLFNDANKKFSDVLCAEAEQMDGYSKLAYKPHFESQQINEEFVERIEKLNLVPTLMFVDPWGYKNLSLRLINSVLKHKASEVIFFFNYRRINAALTNKYFTQHIDNLFEARRAQELRKRFKNRSPTLTPYQREQEIIKQVTEALIHDYGKHVLSFRFMNSTGTRCSHHIIFVTKHPLGYGVMKDIMAKHSTGSVDGVQTYEFNPRLLKNKQASLELESPIDDLALSLCQDFSGKKLTVEDIYHAHHLGKPYIKSNYKIALIRLEQKDKIMINPPASERRKGTLTDSALVNFPPFR